MPAKDPVRADYISHRHASRHPHICLNCLCYPMGNESRFITLTLQIYMHGPMHLVSADTCGRVSLHSEQCVKMKYARHL